MSENDIFEEQRKLVLARLNTLNPDAKMMAGNNKQVTVKDLIKHVEKNDQFGKDIVNVQMRMFRVLAGVE